MTRKKKTFWNNMLSQSVPQRVCKSEKATVKYKYLKRKNITGIKYLLKNKILKFAKTLRGNHGPPASSPLLLYAVPCKQAVACSKYI